MLVQTDMSDVVTVTPGVYHVRVTDSEVKMTKSKNEPRIMWKLAIFDAEDARVNDRTITYGTMAVGPGAGFLRDFYEAATGTAWEDGCLTDTEQLHGCELDVTVKDGVDQRGNKTGFPEVTGVAKLGTLQGAA